MVQLYFSLFVLFSGIFLCLKGMTDFLINYKYTLTFDKIIISSTIFIIGLVYSTMAIIILSV